MGKRYSIRESIENVNRLKANRCPYEMDNLTFVRNVKFLCEMNGITQADYFRAIEVSGQFLVNHTIKYMPDVRSLYETSRLFGISINDLISKKLWEVE